MKTILAAALTVSSACFSFGCTRCPSPQTESAASVQVQTRDLEEAVEVLFETTQVQKVYEKVIPQALDDQIAQNANLAKLRDVLAAFLEKYMGWEVVGPELKKMYMASFTKEEIDHMIAFYRTPAGQKAAKLTPELMTKASAIGREMVNAHLPELKAMVAAKLEQLSTPQPPAENAE